MITVERTEARPYILPKLAYLPGPFKIDLAPISYTGQELSTSTAPRSFEIFDSKKNKSSAASLGYIMKQATDLHILNAFSITEERTVHFDPAMLTEEQRQTLRDRGLARKITALSFSEHVITERTAVKYERKKRIKRDGVVPMQHQQEHQHEGAIDRLAETLSGSKNEPSSRTPEEMRQWNGSVLEMDVNQNVDFTTYSAEEIARREDFDEKVRKNRKRLSQTASIFAGALGLLAVGIGLAFTTRSSDNASPSGITEPIPSHDANRLAQEAKALGVNLFHNATIAPQDITPQNNVLADKIKKSNIFQTVVRKIKESTSANIGTETIKAGTIFESALTKTQMPAEVPATTVTVTESVPDVSASQNMPIIILDNTHVHIVKQGEYLRKIAQEDLGDESRWKEIYKTNKDIIGSNPDLIQPGMQLVEPN